MAESTVSAEQFNGLVSAMTGLTDLIKKDVEERRAAAEAATRPADVDALAVAEAVTTSGLPTAMHASVFAAVKAGADVDAAIESAKATVQSIVTEAGGKTPAPLVLGAPKTGAVISTESLDAALTSYLLGK